MMTTESAITSDSTISASKENLLTRLKEGAVILDINSGVYFGVDGVGIEIWNLIQEPTEVARVIDSIAGEYRIERERAEADVLRFLNDLAEHRLIEIKP
jgi:hypothetical protein